jgi:hypothetical protein
MKNKNVGINFRTVLSVVIGIAVLFVFFAASQLTLTGAETRKPAEANRMEPGHAPTPFSAGEIRSGCPKGRKIVYQVEMYGKPLLFRTTEFVSANKEGTVMESTTKGADGKQVGKRQMVIAKWKELQAHASFPADQTEIGSEKYKTPAGTFDCWLYTVKETKAGKTNIKRLWFAISLPGPPVCYEETIDGKMAYRLVMLKTGR